MCMDLVVAVLRKKKNGRWLDVDGSNVCDDYKSETGVCHPIGFLVTFHP